MVQSSGFPRTQDIKSIRRAVFYLISLTLMFTWYVNLSVLEHGSRLKGEESSDQEKYDENMPILFVGGVGRSGTTLMRSIFDAHSHIRCGRECPAIKVILKTLAMSRGNNVVRQTLEDAAMDAEVMDAAMQKYILELAVHHGDPAKRYCKKDPNLLLYASYLSKIFQNAKFVMMIRDGRDVAQSVMLRNIPMWGSFSTVGEGLDKWDIEARLVDGQCTIVGPKRCFPVIYEHLVLKPKETMEALLHFLELPWEEDVLHHESLVGSKVVLTPGQPSASQVLKAINPKAVFRWNVEKESAKANTTPTAMREISDTSQMLLKYGYQHIHSHADFEKLGPVNYECKENECRNAWFFDLERELPTPRKREENAATTEAAKDAGEKGGAKAAKGAGGKNSTREKRETGMKKKKMNATKLKKAAKGAKNKKDKKQKKKKAE